MVFRQVDTVAYIGRLSAKPHVLPPTKLAALTKWLTPRRMNFQKIRQYVVTMRRWWRVRCSSVCKGPNGKTIGRKLMGPHITHRHTRTWPKWDLCCSKLILEIIFFSFRHSPLSLSDISILWLYTTCVAGGRWQVYGLLCWILCFGTWKQGGIKVCL